MKGLRGRVAVSAGWSFLEVLFSKSIITILMLLLAWFLVPEDFALLAMLAVFIQMASFSVEGGFSEALIRKKNLNGEELSSVFFVNIFLSIFLYVLFYFLAPIIAKIYQQQELVKLIRVVMISVFFQSSFVVHKAILTRELEFKSQAGIAVPAVLFSSVLAMLVAYYGYGVWALIFQIVGTSFFSALLYWRKSSWRPRFIFSFQAIYSLWGFSKYLLLARFINIPFKNLYFILLPKFFLAGPVGLYFFADKAKDAILSLLVTSVQKVTYPILSTLQEDNEVLKARYRTVLVSTCFFLMPVFAFLGVMAPALFEIALPMKWWGAAEYLQLMCLAAFFSPLHALNLNILKVKGRSDLLLYVGIIKKVVIVVVLVYTLQFDIRMVLIGQILASMVNYLPNAYYSSKLIGYSTLEQLVDFMPPLLLSCVTGVIIWRVQNWLLWEPLLELFFLLILAIVAYLTMAFWLKLDGFVLVKNLLLRKQEA